MKKPIEFPGLNLPDGETWESLNNELSRVAVYGRWWNGIDGVNQYLYIASVGSKAANALGIHDMSGNVPLKEDQYVLFPCTALQEKKISIDIKQALYKHILKDNK